MSTNEFLKTVQILVIYFVFIANYALFCFSDDSRKDLNNSAPNSSGFIIQELQTSNGLQRIETKAERK
jgi:hypothetical protein